MALPRFPVDLGDPVRNAPARRWEIPVGGWVHIDKRRDALKHPAQAWEIVGEVERHHRLVTAKELRCDCCGKPAAGDLLVIAVRKGGYRERGDDRAVYQVDIRHAARRLGRGVEELRAEQAERRRQAAKQLQAAHLATRP